MSVEIDLGGSVAVVTGSGAGIGREIARWLARGGAHVAVIDVRADKASSVVAEIAAEGGSAEVVIADFRDDDAIDDAIVDVAARNGRLDVAVNNIGMFPAGRGPRPFVQTTGGDWRDVVDQNLITAALSARVEAEVMMGMGNRGVIIFVTSGETTRPSPVMATYAAAKTAINHLVTTLAVELGSAGIRVLAVAPGTTDTETVAATMSQEQLDAIAASTPLGQRVEHDELGRLVVFLASDLARAITGQFVLADAGAFLSRNRPSIMG